LFGIHVPVPQTVVHTSLFVAPIWTWRPEG
jgi:hypothetical protein